MMNMDPLISLAKLHAGQALMKTGSDLMKDAKNDPEWLGLGKGLVGLKIFNTGLKMMRIRGDDE